MNQSKFDILESEKSTLILDMPFLLKNKCIIDLENCIITVDKQQFELNENTVPTS